MKHFSPEEHYAKVKYKVNLEMPWGDLFAKRENFIFGLFSEESRLVKKYLKPASTVLIIGSGNGREARPLCGNGHRIICMDIGLLYLLSGKKLFASEDIQNVHFIKADLTNLPFRRVCYDFIFFSLYGFAAEKRFDVLRGLHQTLKPEGFILITTATPQHRKYGQPGWVWMESVEQLRDEITSCGFEFVESNIDQERREYRMSMIKNK